MNDTFHDRQDAGRAVASMLSAYQGAPDLLVLGLPRGGVPVAAEVAQLLGAPMDVLVVRKVGMPGHAEFALGAIAAVDGQAATVRNDAAAQLLGRGFQDAFDHVAEQEHHELRRRQQQYRGDRGPLALTGKTVILVDDGLATGATMRAAIEAVTQLQPARLIAAVPVSSREAAAEISALVDEFICVQTPPLFRAVGRAYESFDQTTDEEVQRLLEDRRDDPRRR